MLGPSLESERVRIEPILAADLPWLTRWMSDLENTRYLIGIFPPGSGWLGAMERSQEDVVWCVRERPSGRLVGFCGLYRLIWRHRNVAGWTLIDRSCRSAGLGTGAWRLRTDFAFVHLGMEKVITEIYAENVPSRRVAQKLGFREVGVMRRHRFSHGQWHDLWVGEVTRDEWLSQPQSAVTSRSKLDATTVGVAAT